METCSKVVRSRQMTIPLKFPESQCIATLHGLSNRKILQIACSFLDSDDSHIFYIHSPHQTGKTHFLRAICREGIDRGRRAAYISFKHQHSVTNEMLEDAEEYDLLAIDDINLMKERKGGEIPLFHLVNRFMSSPECKLFVAADTEPKKIGFKLTDLVSRLSWGHLYKLEELNKKDCIAALCQRAEGKFLTLTPDAANFLYKRFNGRRKELFDLLELLDRASLTAQRRLTIPFIKSVLNL